MFSSDDSPSHSYDAIQTLATFGPTPQDSFCSQDTGESRGNELKPEVSVADSYSQEKSSIGL